MNMTGVVSFPGVWASGTILGAPLGIHCLAPAGLSPSGRRHCPTGTPSVLSMAFVGIGFGASSPVSNAKLSSIRLLTRRA